MFSAERAQKLADHNLQNKERKREALRALESEDVQKRIASQISEGGFAGRKLLREVQRFESTGRINNWLSNEILKTSVSVSSKGSEFPETIVSYGQAINPRSGVAAVAPSGNKNKNQILSGGTGGGVATIRMPWDFYIKETVRNSNGDIVSYVVGVQAGTLSGILPTNWNQPFQVLGGILYYGIAYVSTDGKFISSVNIGLQTTPPAKQEPQKFSVASSAQILFGMFFNGQNFNIAGGKNIDVAAKVVFVAKKEQPPEVGELPYDFYLRLQ